MATKNSINSNIPIEVTLGGTEVTSTTTYAVPTICGIAPTIAHASKCG